MAGTTTDHSSARTPRTNSGGLWMIAGGLLWAVGALQLELATPGLGELIYASDLPQAYAAIASNVGIFRLHSLLFALSAASVCVGVVLTGRWLRCAQSSQLIDAAVVCVILGTAAWIVEVLGRITLGVSRARQVAGGVPAAPDEYIGMSVWLFQISKLAFVGLVLLAAGLARHRIPGRWSSLLVAVLVSLSALPAIAGVPKAAHVGGSLPLGLALVMGGRHRLPIELPARKE